MFNKQNYSFDNTSQQWYAEPTKSETIAQKATPPKGGILTPDLEHRKRFLVNIFYVAVIIALVFLCFRYLLNLIWPFIIAFLFAWILRAPIRWLTAKCHIKYSISVTICLAIFFILLAGLVAALGVRLVTSLMDFVARLPSVYTNDIEPALAVLATQIEGLSEHLSPSAYEIVTDLISNLAASISQAVSSLSMKAVGWVSGLAAKLPKSLLSALICIIATIFMTADFSRLTSFVMRQIPQRPRHVIQKTKETFVVVIFKYARSYGIIMCITFAEILIGLLLIRQKNAALIAVLVAVFDIFPIVGAGLILVPWAIITMLGGALAKGLGLLALWIVVMVVRQYMEPRVVGHQVGLHPVLTLMAMFVGSKLFGGLGLLGLPIACAIIKSLDDTGVVHLIKKEEDVPVPPMEPATVPQKEESGAEN